jgi:hypothetical protein
LLAIRSAFDLPAQIFVVMVVETTASENHHHSKLAHQ